LQNPGLKEAAEWREDVYFRSCIVFKWNSCQDKFSPSLLLKMQNSLS